MWKLEVGISDDSQRSVCIEKVPYQDFSWISKCGQIVVQLYIVQSAG